MKILASLNTSIRSSFLFIFEMNKILIFLLAFTTFSNAIEYDSLHENTYWFYDDESPVQGWHTGAVRSNIVYGDKLRFAISEKTCDQIPAMYLTLSSILIPDIKKDNPDFDINSIEGNLAKCEILNPDYLGEFTLSIKKVDDLFLVFTVYLIINSINI